MRDIDDTYARKHIKNSLYYHFFGDQELAVLMFKIQAAASRMGVETEKRIMELVPVKNRCTLEDVFAQLKPLVSWQVVIGERIKSGRGSLLIDFIIFDHAKKQFSLIDFSFSGSFSSGQVKHKESNFELGCEIISQKMNYVGKCYICQFSRDEKSPLTNPYFEYITGIALCEMLDIDLKCVKEIWKSNQSSNLRLVSEFVRMPPMILTEGKTDWKHLKAARNALKESGCEIIEFDLFEYSNDFEISDAELLKMCKIYSKTPQLRTIICIFDRDVPSIVNQVLDRDSHYRDWGNNVYSFALPTPNHRVCNPDVCIELYYKDEEIKRNCASQRRLFLNQGKRISNPIDTTVLGFIQNAKKFKSTTLGRRVGLTFWLLCGRNL